MLRAYLLLRTSAQSLPPPRIEQVFEADSEESNTATVERRSKSGLTRAERIEAVRARRAASGSSKSSGDRKLEVVRELKAVISEIGVRRRRAEIPPGLPLSRTKTGAEAVVINESESSTWLV